jgi:hypothetical protein
MMAGTLMMEAVMTLAAVTIDRPVMNITVSAQDVAGRWFWCLSFTWGRIAGHTQGQALFVLQAPEVPVCMAPCCWPRACGS